MQNPDDSISMSNTPDSESLDKENPEVDPKSLPPKERFSEAAKAKQVSSDDEDEEHELWSGSYSHLAMIGTWGIAGLVTIGLPILALLMSFSAKAWLTLIGLIVVGWVGLWLWYAYRRYSVHYTLSNQRFVHESGLLWRTVDRVELIDIDDVTYLQGPVERAFGVGTIRLDSSDATTPKLMLPGIAEVRKIADLIDDARRKERRSRGLHIEQV